MARTDQNQEDHDLLVELNTKFGQLVKNMEIFTTAFERRLEAQESKSSVIDRLDVAAIKLQTEKNTMWISEFKVTWKVVLTIAGAAGGFIGFLVSIVFFFLNYVKPS